MKRQPKSMNEKRKKLLMNVARSTDSVLSAPFPAGDTEGRVAGSRRSGVSSLRRISPRYDGVNARSRPIDKC